MRLAPLSARHRDDVAGIAASLQQWFDASAIRNIPIDARYHHGFVAEVEGRVVGFVTYSTHEGVGQITWLGVLAEYHRHGIGRGLVEAAVEDLRKNGVTELRVDTLSDSVEYKPYERTRCFYAAMGFVEHERIPMPDNPSCPEKLVLTKAI
ncbi:MAG: GNAT family N-acetyltransferase [Planctomycetota bacterium]|jgi:GNAT superfamily N-acetyltransferase